MDYCLESDNEYESELDFPEGLSYFFEQLGGYGEYSMVAQVSSILGINLEIFQNTYYDGMEDDYDEDEIDEDDFWIELSTLQKTVESFISAIHTKPDYFKMVKFNGPYSPEDNGYLSQGHLLKDLEELKVVLGKYKENGTDKIRLIYS